MSKKNKGWEGESKRHALAAKGISTGRKARDLLSTAWEIILKTIMEGLIRKRVGRETLISSGKNKATLPLLFS